MLTDRNFAKKMKDYFAHVAQPSVSDIALLKVGRHFRLDNGDKVVLARDRLEGEALRRLVRPEEHLLVPDFGAPVTLIEGTSIAQGVRMMLSYGKAPPDGSSIIHFHNGQSHLLSPFQTPGTEA